MIKRRIIKKISTVLMLSYFFLNSNAALATEKEILIFVDEEILELDQQPMLLENRTFVPLRTIADVTGAQIYWSQEQQTVSLEKGELGIIFKIGSKIGVSNKKEIEMPESFISDNNRTMVPLRFLSEFMGIDVKWNQEMYTVNIKTPTVVESEIYVAKGGTVEGVIQFAEGFIGTPYQYGASTENTDYFDCSSFTQFVYKKNGIVLSRRSADQVLEGEKIEKEELKKGDLVFFDIQTPVNKSLQDEEGIKLLSEEGDFLSDKIEGELEKREINHVAIYIDENTLLHATTSLGVSYTSFGDYWKDRYVTGARVFKDQS